jgi:rhamnulokinase
VALATGLDVPAVIAPASHDTASAVVAVPFSGPDAAFISSGTWSLMGVETDAPVLSDPDLSNEGGPEGRNRLQTNIAGLWLLQECRRRWRAERRAHDYAELVALAVAAPPLVTLIDVDDPSLIAPGDMPARIRRLCAESGEPVPETIGALVRCVLESLALAYRRVLARLERATGRTLGAIHVVGGGARNRPLCQWTADACGVPVIAGPFEATTLGNAIVQLVALDALGGIDDGRRVVAASVDTVVFEPAAEPAWDAAAARLARGPTAASPVAG